MIRNITPIVAVLALANSLVAQNTQPVDQAREKIQKWVETRQVIAKERADWKVQKETLGSTKELLQQELADLEVKLADLQGNESSADAKRAELTEEKLGLDAATDAVRQKVAAMEVRIKDMSKLFPTPLLNMVDPLMKRIPEDPYRPGRQTVGERLPTIVGVLQQAAKFNSTLHHFTETVPYEGKELQVDVIYWGMSIAYFVDANNTFAGYKVPSASGWKTVEMPEVAEQIRLLVNMYQRRTPNIEFVEIPVAIN
jgi:hypothetical protein